MANTNLPFRVYCVYNTDDDGRELSIRGVYTVEDDAKKSQMNNIYTHITPRWAINSPVGVFLLETTASSPHPVDLNNEKSKARESLREAALDKLSEAERFALGI